MTQPTTNHELLQNAIDMYPYRDDENGMDLHSQHNRFREQLEEIQSRLIEPMEYETGKEYEFNNIESGREWETRKLKGYLADYGLHSYKSFDMIRPLTISPELT